MIIGTDFPKIEFSLFGLDLVEPNAFIGDTLILAVALLFAYKTHKISVDQSFYKYWKWFFIVFGVSFFAGGLAHVFFNYWGVPGKHFSWYSGIFAVCLIEMAMISVFPLQNWVKNLQRIAVIKLVVVLIVQTIIINTIDLSVDPQKGLIIPTVNSVLGLGLALGFLSAYYQRKISSSFKYLWISTLVLIPNTAIQGMKINIHPWFDRNDFSHVLLITGLIFYMIAITKRGQENALNPIQK
jgi:hypothetical protein